MADIFTREDARELLSKQRIMFIGDSNVRAIYKDWLWLLQNHTIIPQHFLKSKLEPSFAGDSLIAQSALHNGVTFTETREYQDAYVYLLFMFVTRCLTNDMKLLFEKFKSKEKPAPDIIIFNSCVWDISRWGRDGITQYQNNMRALMLLMHNCIPLTTLVIFTTTLPISNEMRGGFLVPEVQYLKKFIPYDVLEANQFIRRLVVAHGFDVVDLHFQVKFQIHKRADDGIHWHPRVVRHMTNVLLTHISISMGVELPGRARRYARRRMECVESAEPIGRTVDYKLSEPTPTCTLDDFEDSSNCSTCSSNSIDPCMECVESAEPIGCTVDYQLSEPTPTCTLDDFEDSSNCSTCSSNSIDPRMECVESAEPIGRTVDYQLSDPAPTCTLDDFEDSSNCSTCLSNSIDPLSKFKNIFSECGEDVPDDIEAPEQSYGNQRAAASKQGPLLNVPVMQSLYKAPKQTDGHHTAAASKQGPLMNVSLTYEAPKQTFANQRAVASKRGPLLNVPVMENLYKAPKQTYEHQRSAASKQDEENDTPFLKNLHNTLVEMYGKPRQNINYNHNYMKYESFLGERYTPSMSMKEKCDQGDDNADKGRDQWSSKQCYKSSIPWQEKYGQGAYNQEFWKDQSLLEQSNLSNMPWQEKYGQGAYNQEFWNDRSLLEQSNLSNMPWQEKYGQGANNQEFWKDQSLLEQSNLSNIPRQEKYGQGVWNQNILIDQPVWEQHYRPSVPYLEKPASIYIEPYPYSNRRGAGNWNYEPFLGEHYRSSMSMEEKYGQGAYNQEFWKDQSLLEQSNLSNMPWQEKYGQGVWNQHFLMDQPVWEQHYMPSVPSVPFLEKPASIHIEPYPRSNRRGARKRNRRRGNFTKATF